jgi:hypothetical protein
MTENERPVCFDGQRGAPHYEEWREAMGVQTTRAKLVTMGMVSWFVIVTFAAIGGCANEKPKPMQQPSPEQVKGSAERSFDKLKQEERERKSTGQ